MLISTRGRYAIRVLLDMAERRTEDYVPLKEIASRQEISEKYLESILKSLVQHKILSGQRGKGGGYKLITPPEKISVGQVLRLTEPNFGTVTCLEDNYDCARCDSCRTRPMWKELDDLILEYLDSRSIASMAEPTELAQEPTILASEKDCEKN